MSTSHFIVFALILIDHKITSGTSLETPRARWNFLGGTEN
jgi:hypothetical protein